MYLKLRVFAPLLALLLFFGHGAESAAGAGKARVVSRSVTFDVRNTNGSTLACPSDGAPYQVKGWLVGPASKLAATARRARGVTLYLHEFSFGSWFWNFKSVAGHNYVRSQARSGRVSVVVDRLGYGASGHPDGNQVCLGSHADVAHQIIGKLRSGDYAVRGGTAPAFRKIALAGHSVGAQIAQLEAYSFRDVDALIIMSWALQVSERSVRDFYATRVVCVAGGEPTEPGGPGGYAYFGQTPKDFRTNSFFSARPSVAAAAAALRHRDPCGDSASLIGAYLRDQVSLREIKVPVLLVCGEKDAIIPSFLCANHEKRFSGSRDFSLRFIPRAGHGLALERTAPTFRETVSRWLRKRGF